MKTSRRSVRPKRWRMRSTARCTPPPIRSRHWTPLSSRLALPRPSISARRRWRPRVHPPIEVQTPPGRVPHWFVDLLGVPEIGASFPVTIEGKRVGDIVFVPDLSADLFEKWIGFLAHGLLRHRPDGADGHHRLFFGGVRHPAAARSRRRADPDAQGRLRHADPRVRAAGDPAELRGSQRACPHLAPVEPGQPDLLRKIVSLQDDERRDIARELHDEFGPLLFGIRANTVALLEAVAARPGGISTARPGSCNRSRRCSRPTAASWTGCGRFTSRNWAWRRASRRCCGIRRRRRRPQTDVTHRSAPERDRRPAVADDLSRDPGRRDQRAAPRQGATQCNVQAASSATAS